jgi:hypothetical protein
MRQNSLPVSRVRRDLRQPNGSLDRLDLAKELSDSAVFAVPPVLQKLSGFRGHLPLRRIRQGTPCVYIAANFINDRGRIVLLLLGRKSLPFLEYESLCALALCFLGLGIGVMNFALRRLSIIFCVGWPASSSSQCRRGYSYGAFRIGLSKNVFHISLFSRGTREYYIRFRAARLIFGRAIEGCCAI